LLKDSRIFVAGADTMIGSALVRELRRQGYQHVVDARPNLTDRTEVESFFAAEQPEYVFMAAGRSGGIAANQKYPADLMLDNLLAQNHVITAAHNQRVARMLFLASSCSYPRDAPQPMQTSSLFTGPVEPTNEGYAVAKLSGITLCKAFRQQYGDRFIAGIPANSFGPEDDFSPEDSHVVSALMLKMYEAKTAGRPSVEIWGSGAARREFIFVDDLANACIFVMNHYEGADPINIGSGDDVSIRELATLIREVADYGGDLEFDTRKPDGMPLKSLDSTVLQELGWRPQTTLRAGLAITYDWFLTHQAERTRSLELAHVR